MKTPQSDKTMHQQSSMSTTKGTKGPSKKWIRKLVLYLILIGLSVGYVLSACLPASQTTVEEPATKEVLTTSQIPDNTTQASEVTTPVTTEQPTEGPEPVLYRLTAYCPCEVCCGKSDGITATGVRATEGRTVAVDPSTIPYGSEVVIWGHTYVAEDCGGAVQGNRIDIFFDTHQEAVDFGVQYAEVAVK